MTAQRISLLLSVVATVIVFVQGASGPVDYRYLGNDWSGTCATGTHQTPINIELEHTVAGTLEHTVAGNSHRRLLDATDFEKRNLSSAAVVEVVTREENQNITFLVADGTRNVSITDKGTTFVVDFKDGTLAFWNHEKEIKLYHMLQFHIHCPSEHTFDEKYYDCEVHFVHQSYDLQTLAVVGVFFDIEAGGHEENSFIKSLQVGTLPPLGSKILTSIPNLEWINKLNKDKFYHYSGSLTTPPCSEIVTWVLINDPQPISHDQLAQFNNKWLYNGSFASGKGNNRAIQPLNDRIVYHYTETNAFKLALSIFNFALLFQLF